MNVLGQIKFTVIFFYNFPSLSVSFPSLGILEKNRDTFSADLNDLIGKSKCKFLLHLFEKELKMVCCSYYALYYP